MATRDEIRVGDRVEVLLRTASGRGSRGRRWRWMPGTVARVDDGGVHLDLDDVVNGVSTAYATYQEVMKTVEPQH